MVTPQPDGDASATRLAAWLTAGCVALSVALWAATCSQASGAAVPDVPRGAVTYLPAPRVQRQPVSEHEDVAMYREKVAGFQRNWGRLYEHTRDTLDKGRVRLDMSIGRNGADSESQRSRVLRLAENMVVDVWNRETESFNAFAKAAARKVDGGTYSSRDRDSIINCIGDATDLLNKMRQDLLVEAQRIYGR